MELKQIKELMALMGRTGTKKLVIKQGEFELELEREGKAVSYRDEDELQNNPMKVELEQHRVQASPSKPTVEEEKLEGHFITSPMVGTFYQSPSPDDPPFVKIGETVNKGDVVCIIEAMKVMNEVKADVTGVLKQVMVESGHPVEFGTKLFIVSEVR